MDLQYVEDIAEAFVGCLLSNLEGAHVFNLQGTVVSMQEIIDMIDDLRPGTRRLLSFDGPQVPVAYRVDDSNLRASVPDLPKTPLIEGFRRTLAHYEAIHARTAAAG